MRKKSQPAHAAEPAPQQLPFRRELPAQPLKQVTVYLPRSQWRSLRIAAARRGISMGGLVRQLAEQHPDWTAVIGEQADAR